MNKDEFKRWIYDNYNVPENNCTLAPQMLDSIMDYAEEITWREGLGEAHLFILRMLPSLPQSIIQRVVL